jgi:hypothetical protein
MTHDFFRKIAIRSKIARRMKKFVVSCTSASRIIIRVTAR